MSVERKCENCANGEPGNCDSTWCYPSNNYETFVPKEELVRADERAKLRDKIVSEYSYYNFMCRENIENEEIRKIYGPTSHVLLELIRFLNDLDFGREQ